MDPEASIVGKISAAAANVSCFSSLTVAASASAAAGEQNGEKEGLGTVSFYGGAGNRFSVAEAGTGTICFTGETQQQQQQQQQLTPCPEGLPGRSSDLVKKEETKAACPPFRGSRFKPLLGRPRRVLRSDDSTGSDESIEVLDHQHQSESKASGAAGVGATSKLQLLNGIAGLKEELLILRKVSTEAVRSSGELSAEEPPVSRKDPGSPPKPAAAEQARSQNSPASTDKAASEPSNSPPAEAEVVNERQPAAEQAAPGKAESAPPAAEESSSSPADASKREEDARVLQTAADRPINPRPPTEDSQLKSENPKANEAAKAPQESLEAKETDASRKAARENANFVWVNSKRYQKLGKIGSGGSSHVFKVIAQDCTIYALKRIILKGKPHQTACGFHQEIEYLERLRGKRHIIQLIDYEVTDKNIFRSDYAAHGDIQSDVRIYMVLEYGEIDLDRMLERKKNEDGELDENWLRLYWEHILKAVNTIHEERIVHADLKPANFLLVQGALKLIDFGIAKAIQNDTTNVVRESQAGTVNYMSPEAFMMNSRDENGTVKCGRSSDIWSLGCILYRMVHGRTPFSHLINVYQKITEITNPKHVIDFPPVCGPLIVDVMKSCLQWDKGRRPRIPQLLEHPFLRPRPPEDPQEYLREALLQSCRAYVSAKGSVQLTELIRRLVKGAAAPGGNSNSSSSLTMEQLDSVLLPFAKLYMQKAGKPALHELLTSVIL